MRYRCVGVNSKGVDEILCRLADGEGHGRGKSYSHDVGARVVIFFLVGHWGDE